jgi:hypothetical protein
MDLNHSFKSCQRREDGCDESKNIRLEPVAERANAIRPYGILDEIKSVLCNKFPKNKILIYNPWNPVNPLNQWFKLIITENIPPKQAPPKSPMEITRAAAIGLNQGFKGFQDFTV